MYSEQHVRVLDKARWLQKRASSCAYILLMASKGLALFAAFVGWNTTCPMGWNIGSITRLKLLNIIDFFDIFAKIHVLILCAVFKIMKGNGEFLQSVLQT